MDATLSGPDASVDRIKTAARLHAARERLDDALARSDAPAAAQSAVTEIPSKRLIGPGGGQRVLSDDILAAFHVACDGGDLILAARLLSIAEGHLTRSGAHDSPPPKSLRALVAAHERFWNVRITAPPIEPTSNFRHAPAVVRRAVIHACTPQDHYEEPTHDDR